LPAVALSGLAIVPARASSRVVYLMRGALGFMFSTGLDGLAAELQARGISTWLGSYIEAVAVRAMIEKDLRAGIRVGIVGHSLGGNAAIADGEGAALIVTIDPTPSVGARPAHVGRLINFRSTLGGLGGGCPAGASEDHPLAIDHVSMAGASVVHRTVIAAALGM
jgi:hypothetical protein